MQNFKLYDSYSLDKQFMVDMIFGEFSILPEYVISEKEDDNILVVELKDELEQEAILTIDFNTNDYTIEIDGYVETKEFILVD